MRVWEDLGVVGEREEGGMEGEWKWGDEGGRGKEEGGCVARGVGGALGRD